MAEIEFAMEADMFVQFVGIFFFLFLLSLNGSSRVLTTIELLFLLKECCQKENNSILNWQLIDDVKVKVN